MREQRLFTIEGNVGASKTTTCKAIEATGRAGVIYEPVAGWKERYEENILDLFYNDPSRYAFTFQLAAFSLRSKTWREVLALTDHSTVFLDRSIFSDRYIFAQSLYEQGIMSATEFQIYSENWDFLVSQYCVKPEKFIYIRTPAEVCLERVRTRGRKEEESVTLEYLQQLEKRHDEWLQNNNDCVILSGIEHIDANALLDELGIP